MSLEAIYVVRHGFRSSWAVDPATGAYSAHVPSPTGIAADPALTAHGLAQARELGRRLAALDPPADAVYSSPFYRCLQTLAPFVELRGGSVRAEHGLGEWFGAAPFRHPRPAPAAVLRALFPAVDAGYVSAVVPPARGETPAQLRRRAAAALRAIVRRADAEGARAVLLCTHAAVVIVAGRVLTGRLPARVDADDFHAYTCGLTVFRRRPRADGRDGEAPWSGLAGEGTHEATEGLIGGWHCELDSDCSFLSGGQERGWKFSGDESFPGTESPDAEPKL